MTDNNTTPVELAAVATLIAEIGAPLTETEIAHEVVEMQKLIDKLAPRRLLNNQPAIEKIRARVIEDGGTLICDKKKWIYQASPDAPELTMTGREFAEWRTNYASPAKSDI